MKVSVIVPTFNQSIYLIERVMSIYNQNYKNFDVTVLDDFSSDNSKITLNELKKRYPNLNLYFFSYNSNSPFGRWKEAFDLAKGDLIWIAEGDDCSNENFLEKLIPLFKNEYVVVAHTRSIQFENSKGKTQINSWWDTFSPNIWVSDYVKSGKDLLSFYGKYKCPIVNVSSAIFRKSALNGIEIPNKFKYAGDWYFWNQLFMQGDVAFIAEPLNHIRIHDNSATNSKNADKWEKLIENLTVIKYVNRKLNSEVIYNTNYRWFLLAWKIEFRKDLFRGLYFSFKYLPISFLLHLFKPIK